MDYGPVTRLFGGIALGASILLFVSYNFWKEIKMAFDIDSVAYIIAKCKKCGEEQNIDMEELATAYSFAFGIDEEDIEPCPCEEEQE